MAGKTLRLVNRNRLTMLQFFILGPLPSRLPPQVPSGEPRGRDRYRGSLTGTAAPEALAGMRGQPERGYNKAGAGGFPVAHLRGGSGERRGRHAVTKLPEVNAKHPETVHNGIRPAPSEQNFRVL
jgi:hypothetical protein